MSRDMWDPEQYGVFADERDRPFFELAAQIHANAPSRVADLGCGNGLLTLTLAQRWPNATIEAIDSSPEMIAAAHQALAARQRADTATGADLTPPGGGLSANEPPRSGSEAPPRGQGGLERVRFSVGDVGEWKPDGPLDVIVSNAVLQWVPEHRELLVRWAGWLKTGGWLAFQVPGNFGQPSHVILREICESPRWRDRLGGVLRADPVGDPAEYLALLAGAGCRVNAWETTYAQVLPGENPVLEWVKGTALRPVLTVLGEGTLDAAEFLGEYAARLREAYPATPHGTVFPFRRIFAVARREP